MHGCLVLQRQPTPSTRRLRRAFPCRNRHRSTNRAIGSLITSSTLDQSRFRYFRSKVSPCPGAAAQRGRPGQGSCREIFETVRTPLCTCSGAGSEFSEVTYRAWGSKSQISNLRRPERIARWLKPCDLGGALARLRCNHVDRFLALDREPRVFSAIRAY